MQLKAITTAILTTIPISIPSFITSIPPLPDLLTSVSHPKKALPICFWTLDLTLRPIKITGLYEIDYSYLLYSFPLLLNNDSFLCERRNRVFHGLKGEVDEHAFLSEASGTLRSSPDSYFDNPLRMNSYLNQSEQKSCSSLQGGYSLLQLQNLTDVSKQQEQQRQEQHCFVLGTDFNSERPVKVEREEESQQPLRHFFDERPTKNRDSWLDLEEDRSKQASFSTTQLSISISMPSPEFPVSNFRTQNGNLIISDFQPTSFGVLFLPFLSLFFILFKTFLFFVQMIEFSSKWICTCRRVDCLLFLVSLFFTGLRTSMFFEFVVE